MYIYQDGTTSGQVTSCMGCSGWVPFVGLLAVAFAPKSQKLNQRAQKLHVLLSKSSFCSSTIAKALGPLLSMTSGAKTYPPASDYVGNDSFPFISRTSLSHPSHHTCPPALPSLASNPGSGGGSSISGEPSRRRQTLPLQVSGECVPVCPASMSSTT
jgi:hypothetical protein